MTTNEELKSLLVNEIIEEIIDDEKRLKVIREQEDQSDDIKFLLQMLDEAKSYQDYLNKRLYEEMGKNQK